jgi:arylformamidase
MPSKDQFPDSPVTRRVLLTAAGATAGAVALSAGPADAQRCPGPPHIKGPPVWLGLDQSELDDAYDQPVYAFNAGNISERRTANSEIALGTIGKPARASYGDREIEGIDIFRTKKANAPIVLFIHGGAWRAGRAAQDSYMAEPFIKAGAHFLLVDFNNVLETNGDLFPMFDQLRRAVAWTYRNARSFGGDPDRIYVIAHSSGAHFGGCLVATDWSQLGLPQNIIKGALLGSGIYDLRPARMSKRSSYVKFTDEMEEALSPQRHIDRIETPLTLTYGSLETPEFQRQSRDFHQALIAARRPATLLVGKGYNHYETQETLGNPYGFMGRPAMQMLRLAA